MRTCRLFLSVLVLLALVLPLTGCNAGGCGGTMPTVRLGLPSVDIPPPLSLYTPPDIRPSAYALVTPQPAACTQPQQVQLYAQPAPAPAYRYAPTPMPRARAVGPCADPGPTYSPPPLPGDPNEPPESIPAFRQ